MLKDALPSCHSNMAKVELEERVSRRVCVQVIVVKSINWIYQDDIRNFQSVEIAEFPQDFLLADRYSPGISHDERLLREGKI